MNKRRERQRDRMPIEEAVRLAMVDLFKGYGTVAVEAHDHDDTQGIVVMVTPSQLATASEEGLSDLLTEAGATMHRLVPADHRLHRWTISVDQGDLHFGRISFWDE